MSGLPCLPDAVCLAGPKKRRRSGKENDAVLSCCVSIIRHDAAICGTAP